MKIQIQAQIQIQVQMKIQIYAQIQNTFLGATLNEDEDLPRISEYIEKL